MKRTLHLRTEVLSELTTDDLQNVAGGDGTTYACSRHQCPSLDYCVPTLPLERCFNQ